MNLRKKPVGMILVGAAFILLSLMTFFSSIATALHHSRGLRPGPFLQALDIPYGILMGAFDQILGVPLFFIYFFGGQSLVALLIGGLGFFLICGKNWAGVWLRAFSWFNFIILSLNLGPVIRDITLGRPYTARSLGVILGIVFYLCSALYLTRCLSKPSIQ